MSSPTRPPIALFAYNRVDHLRETVAALRSNIGATESNLSVFLDGPRDDADAIAVADVRAFAATIDGFADVQLLPAERNRGLARSIIGGVSELVARDGRVIVIEDDIVTAPNTLNYFQFMLERYAAQPNVFSVSAYSHPPSVMPVSSDYDYDVYFIRRMMCWGWATWADRWAQADWDMRGFDDFLKSDSLVSAYKHDIGADSLATLQRCVAGEKDVWACRWVYTHFRAGGLCACPVSSLVDNIGLDGSGANCGTDERLRNKLVGSTGDFRVPPFPFVNSKIFDAFMSVYDPQRQTLSARAGPTAVNTLAAKFRRLGSALSRRARPWPRRILQSVRRTLNALPETSFKLLTAEPSAPLMRLGTQYGGWRIAEGSIAAGDIVLSAGAGEDVSFDVELRNLTACEIHLIDPTPRAKAHFDMIRDLAASGSPAPINKSDVDFYDLKDNTLAGLKFHQLGLWVRDETQRFYTPVNESHVSHSIGNLHQTEHYFEADCRRLTSILETIGANRLAALKMDIEGAEFAVIRDLIRSRLRPRMLMIEFHAGSSEIEKKFKLKTLAHVALLRIFGMRLVSRDGWDYVFESTAR